MKIKVYGFGFNKAKLPKAMKAADVFATMAATAGAKLGKLYRYGTKRVVIEVDGEVSIWWGGMILKIRDSNAFTKLTESNGKAILTAETLAANEKLVELTYFIANQDTGRGLIAHHYHGTSLLSFGNVCSRVFKLAQKSARASALKDKSVAEQKKIRGTFKGELAIEQLCSDTDLKALVKQLKRVSSFELRLATLETKETFLRGVIEKASHEVIKLTFPPESDVSDLADDADELSDRDEIAEIRVIGYDKNKNRREFFKDQNPLVFHEFDYDQVMKGLSINLDDWGASIQGSTMINKLIAVASGASTLALLKSS